MIDVIETDLPPMFGLTKKTLRPTTLRAKGWITLDQIIEKTSTTPGSILGIVLPESEVHVANSSYLFGDDAIQSKCEWSPYSDMEVIGKIGRVVIDGVNKVVDGEVVALAGEGRVLRPLA